MELKRDDIIKALECCIDEVCADCPECPYTDTEDCQRKLSEDALAIIKELTEENAKLARSCTELEQVCKKWQSRVTIECEYTKADTVRKMQKMLHEVAVCNEVDVFDIDEIANELLEVNDET